MNNIIIDNENAEFNHAVDLVNNTNKLIYLTGKAGTGKTTFLKIIKQTTTKKAAVVAPTGIAALNAGGQTIHSFFKIKPSVYIPKDSRLRTIPDPESTNKQTIFDNFCFRVGELKMIKELELLIIDEASMVRCDLLDVIDRLLRVFRGKISQPFGGVQVILIGDLFQLPPVVVSDEWDILKEFYDTPFLFSSLVLKDNLPVYIELHKIYRQKDPMFIDLLNKVRLNELSECDMNNLNKRYNPSILKEENTNSIILATHNHVVDKINSRKLSELTSPLKTYESETRGHFPDLIMPTEKVLTLKVGSQIVFIKNDKDKKYYNGMIAKIKKLYDDRIIVELLSGELVEVTYHIWGNIKHKWNQQENMIQEEVIGAFKQFPVKLAWAITVHKSQGLTFDNVIADLSEAFAPGQVYTALSRCTSYEGLVLKSRITANVIKTDPHVLKFTKGYSNK